MWLLLLAAVVGASASYNQDVQAVKSVKGGHGFNYQGGDISRFYNNNNYHGAGYNATQAGRPGQGPVSSINYEIGVCYIEVPTASLVVDKRHVPAGNGSQPNMSRIRTCCKGYERNVYNYRICEPVCTKECINSLCTAPDTCTCYPDHVRNHAGVCVATCPIGCQNGRCDGGVCLCNPGYRLDIDGKFCMPICRDNCAGLGTCIAPNTCACKEGFQTNPDGSCSLSCGKCENGYCETANECRCRPGYQKDSQGLCVPHCIQPCTSKERCIAPNVCSVMPAHIPQQPNSQNPYGPGQNNTYSVPNQGSPYPMYPYNQNGPQQPNQGSNYPHPNTTNQQGPHHQPSPYNPHQGPNYNQNPYSPQQGSAYPHPNPNQSNQGSNYPYPNPQQPQGNNAQANPNQSQPGSLYPQINPNQPGQGSGYPHPNPNQPGHGPNHPQPNPIYYTPGSNYPQNPYGQNPDNNPGQSQYPNQPSGQTMNVNNPHQPLYPDNQLGPNHTNPSYPGQQYPDTQGPSYNHNQGYNPQYPLNQPNYPSQQHGYYNHGYYNQGSYNQNSYEQTQESSLCSSPCINGMCIDHNRCRCHPGYVTDEMDPTGNRCRPHCPGGCPNGYCEAPHSCACDEGFYRDTSVKGRAACLKRIRRSLRDLVFSIPDYQDQ